MTLEGSLEIGVVTPTSGQIHRTSLLERKEYSKRGNQSRDFQRVQLARRQQQSRTRLDADSWVYSHTANLPKRIKPKVYRYSFNF